METKIIKIGNLKIGGDNPIVVQSMTNTLTKDVNSTISQILKLEKAGCELVRVSVPDIESANAIKEIKKQIKIPIVADVHFDYKLAVSAIENGADKIRINPGNIRIENLVKIIEKAKEYNVAIRVGVNSGSLASVQHKNAEQKANLMVDKALEYVRFFEEQDFTNLVISLKSSDVNTSVLAYQIFSQKSDYPLHLGITESGSIFTGSIKSSVGLGILLNQGIGDTIRVSLSGDPVYEIYAGFNILQSLGLRKKYPEIIACPTCARTTIDVIELVKEVEDLIYSFDWSCDKISNAKLAVMGCIVNGPGEAKEADFGVCGAGDKVAFFEKGEIIQKFEKNKKQEISNFLILKLKEFF